MKQKVVKKVEKRMLVDKVCDLQREICEYERFLGDLIILLAEKKSHTAIENHCHECAGWIWDKIDGLIQENKELKAKLALNLKEES